MDNLTWLISGFGILTGIVGAACTIIVPILLLGGVGFFLYKRSQQSNAARQAAQSWLSTTGTVLMSSVQSRRSGNSTSTFPVVVYQYEVNGKTHQSQTIKAGEQFMNVRILGQADATAARYPIGANVTVYYNPTNPAESALER
ncbi:DUF3592 domain-containing protein [Candidatus Villigracilis saccharophilus]|uniref:DUF3592 domain-containing protein n=1 Tax=Candidatus Villigracilis saccharophilus TaxID=3140684 RepID=UPI0031356663|nr:DUF3592 domain-containing protein [Anaerolineales bacterium]